MAVQLQSSARPHLLVNKLYWLQVAMRTCECSLSSMVHFLKLHDSWAGGSLLIVMLHAYSHACMDAFYDARAGESSWSVGLGNARWDDCLFWKP